MTRADLVRHADGDDGAGLARPLAPLGAGALGLGAGGSAPHNQHKNLLRAVWRGRWIVLLCAAVGVAGGFFYLSRQTPIFASTSRILVEPDTPIIPNDPSGRAQSSNFLQTQCELIKSATILSSVAEVPELRSMRTFEGVDNPVGLLRVNLSAEAGQKDDLIGVSFESPYPTEAATIVDAVIDSYKNYHAARKRSSSAEVLRVLSAEKRDRDKDLREQTKKVVAFKQSHPQLSFANEKGNIIVEQLAKLSDALTTARLDALEAKGAAESAKAMAGDPARMQQWLRLQQGAGGAVGPLAAEIQRLELELMSAEQQLGKSHGTVKSLQTRLDALRLKSEEQAREAFDAYVAAVDQRRAAAEQREAQLKTSFDDQQKAALALNTDESEFALLKAEAQRLEKHCDLLDSRIKEVRITEHADGANSITVLERARPSMAPVRPKRATILFEALVLGLAAGCGLAYLRDWTDQRLGSADEIQAQLGLGVLGVLPHMPGNETAAVRGQKVELDPMSDVAEAYRTIRTAVYFGAPDGRTRTILVTSPAPGDGKTTTASNLAIAMAQAGQRVLLVDCDFRKPTQHRVFGVTDGLGLSNVLAAQMPLSKVVKQTSTRGLYLLPAGPVPRNPSEILNGQAFGQLLARMRDKFDHIVIDSPPVVPVTDARILGASCDVTILVLRARKSTRRVSAQAADSLLGVGSLVLGVVVNDVPRRRNGYGGYYGYGYYRYGNGNGKAAADGLEGKTNGARLPAAVGPANSGDE